MRVLHQQGGKSERLEAMAARAILEDVARELGESVSIARIRAGVRVVLGRQGALGGGSSITAEEFDRLVLLYPEDVRSRTDVISRAFQLDQHLARLERVPVEIGPAGNLTLPYPRGRRSPRSRGLRRDGRSARRTRGSALARHRRPVDRRPRHHRGDRATRFAAGRGLLKPGRSQARPGGDGVRTASGGSDRRARRGRLPCLHAAHRPSRRGASV